MPRTILILIAWLTTGLGVLAGDAVHVMTLSDGSICYGSMQPNNAEGQILFKIDGLSNAIAFPQQSVRSVRRISRPHDFVPKDNAPSDLWIFRLRNQQAVSGVLESWDQETIQIRSNSLGRAQISPKDLLRIEQDFGSGESILSVFNKDEWTDPNESNTWKIDPTRVSATNPGTRLISNFVSPDRCEIRLMIRWSSKPNYSIGFGVKKASQDPVQAQFGVPQGIKLPTVGRKESFGTIETWDNELVLVRESNTDASIQSLGQISGNSIELTIFVDIKEGVFAVQTSDGKLTRLQAHSNVDAGKVQAMQLLNLSGDLTIEALEILKWNGQLPLDFSSAIVQTTNGRRIDGVIDGFDFESKSWIVKTSEISEQLPAKDLIAGSTVRQQTSTNKSPESIEKNEQVSEPKLSSPESALANSNNNQVASWVVLSDGSQLLGHLMPSTEGSIHLKCDALQQPIKIGVDSIRMISSHKDDTAQQRADDTDIWIAKCGLSVIRGKLVQGVDQPLNSALVWQPTDGLNASELDYDQTGEIMPIPKEVAKVSSPKKSTADNQARPAPVLFLGGLLGGAPAERKVKVDDAGKNPPQPGNPQSNASQIQFRSGDSTPAKILQISEGGVRFDSERTTTTFAPNSAVDQVVFRASKRSTLSPEQRKRLLTIPRTQQNDPPTHLIISVAGDFLRGRLIEVVNDQATIEVRGELIRLPVEELSEIVWLYDRDWKTPREKDEKEKDAQSDAVPNRKRQEIFVVYGVQRGISLVPTAVKNGMIEGTSDLLGSSQVALADLVVLFWGPNSGQKARELRNESYRLSLAQMPREAPEGEADSTQSRAHPLVGKPAPQFTLKNLAGDKVELEKLRGKVIVLDFWATWCGPCMQTMPLLDQMLSQFEPSKVQLYAINIQEAKNRIELALNKLGVSPEILLDAEGEIAAAYHANAIPQTVIIDADGNVVKVFVGGGPGVVNQIRTALVDHLETSKN